MPLLQLKAISKTFGPVQALKEVDFEIKSGEVVGLIGENGAGKSTLMKILGGVHAPSSGSILINGSSVSIHDAKEAEQLGISFVHQELNLLDNLDVPHYCPPRKEVRRDKICKSRCPAALVSSSSFMISGMGLTSSS